MHRNTYPYQQSIRIKHKKYKSFKKYFFKKTIQPEIFISKKYKDKEQ